MFGEKDKKEVWHSVSENVTLKENLVIQEEKHHLVVLSWTLLL